jgi:tetratricopeptide (TPR) repeat protein
MLLEVLMGLNEEASQICPYCKKAISFGATQCPHCNNVIKRRAIADADSQDALDQRSKKSKIFKDFINRYEKIEGSQKGRKGSEEISRHAKEIQGKTEEIDGDFSDESPEDLLDEIVGVLDEQISQSEKGDQSKVEEEVVEVYECPICSEDVGENDIRCASCGVEFTEFDEVPDNLLESSIQELDQFIEETTSELGVQGMEDDELQVIQGLAEIKEDVSQIDEDLQMKEALDQQELKMESLMAELDFAVSGKPPVIEKSKKAILPSQCPLCSSKISGDKEFCRKCGMIQATETGADSGQIAEFASRIQDVLKELSPSLKEIEIRRKLLYLDKEISLNLSNEELWFNRGVLLADLESYTKALKSFDTVVKLNPDHKKVWIARANIMAKLDEIEEASRCYKKAFEIMAPDDQHCLKRSRPI